MSEFVLLFRTSEAAARAAMGTPDQAQRSLARWMTWIRGLEAGGHLANPGQPLDRSGAVITGPSRTVTDGPFVEGKDMVLGFIIIAARDLAHAIELAGGCPMLDGGSVEIRPVGAGPS